MIINGTFWKWIKKRERRNDLQEGCSHWTIILFQTKDHTYTYTRTKQTSFVNTICYVFFAIERHAHTKILFTSPSKEIIDDCFCKRTTNKTIYNTPRISNITPKDSRKIRSKSTVYNAKMRRMNVYYTMKNGFDTLYGKRCLLCRSLFALTLNNSSFFNRYEKYEIFFRSFVLIDWSFVFFFLICRCHIWIRRAH